jgi:hypothetical protein
LTVTKDNCSRHSEEEERVCNSVSLSEKSLTRLLIMRLTLC